MMLRIALGTIFGLSLVYLHQVEAESYLYSWLGVIWMAFTSLILDMDNMLDNEILDIEMGRKLECYYVSTEPETTFTIDLREEVTELREEVKYLKAELNSYDGRYEGTYHGED